MSMFNREKAPREKDTRIVPFDARPKEVRETGIDTFNQRTDGVKTWDANTGEPLESSEIGAAAFVDFDKLEKVMKPRLPKLADSLSELTYGEMVQFAQETISGNIMDSLAFDPMEAAAEARTLAKQLHIWLTKRQSPRD